MEFCRNTTEPLRTAPNYNKKKTMPICDCGRVEKPRLLPQKWQQN